MSPTARDLEALHRRLLEAFNPFEDRVVQTPWEAPRYADVRSLHGPISDAILALIRRTGEDGMPRFVLLRGLPGTGKTHLLRRLRLELDDAGTFVTVGPFGDGRRLHRHILRQLCESLDHRRTEADPRSQLQDFALRVLGRAAGDLPLEGWVGERLRREPAFLIEALGQQTDPARLRARVHERHPGVDREVVEILFGLLDPDRTGMAARWLQGVDLPEEDLAALRVRGSAAEEDRAGEVLRALIGLSRDSVPLVLCFDQLEFLPPVEGEPGFVALGKAAVQLAMAGRVVLVLSCLVRTWDEHREQLPGSAVDRLVQHSFILERLTADHVAELLATRLAAARGGCRAPSPTYPFGRGVAAELAAEPGISVRRILERAGTALEEMRRRGRIAPLETLAEFRPAPGPAEGWLEGEAVRRLADLREGGGLPLDEGLVKRGLVLALDLARRRKVALGRLRVEAVEARPRGGRYLDLTADLVVDGARRRAGFCLCNTENGASFAAHPRNLARAMQDPRRGLQAGLLVRDERLLPLPARWRVGHEHLEGLRAAGGSLLPLDRESLAALELLRTLLAEASAGDLSGPDRSATPEDVEAALLRAGALDRAPLWERLAAALSPQPRGPAPDLPAALAAALREHPVLPWSRLHPALAAAFPAAGLADALAAARALPSRILVLAPDADDPIFALRP